MVRVINIFISRVDVFRSFFFVACFLKNLHEQFSHFFSLGNSAADFFFKGGRTSSSPL
jgi:hypothetical protein